jgi:hypothetical protein
MSNEIHVPIENILFYEDVNLGKLTHLVEGINIINGEKYVLVPHNGLDEEITHELVPVWDEAAMGDYEVTDCSYD